MSIPHARKGRHAAPARPSARRLAVAAAALAAGAVPLAYAGTAAAATTPHAAPPTRGLPDLPPPLSLPGSIGPLTQGLPLAGDLPVSDMVDGFTPPLSELVQVGDLGGVLPQRVAQVRPLVRSAEAVPQPDSVAAGAEKMALGAGSLATSADHALTGGAGRAAERLTSAVPLANVVPQRPPASDGALGTLTARFAPQTNDVTGGIVGRAAPVVAQLHRTGVPTVGDLTGGLSATRVPVVGTVGSLTQTLPVTTLLGSGSPVTGALQHLNGL